MLKKRIQEIENDKTVIKLNIFVSILLVTVLFFVSIGFAVYNQDLLLSGTTSLAEQGTFAITNIELTDSINVKSGSVPAYSDDSIDLNLSFEKPTGVTEEGYMAKYIITISNNTFYDYEFSIPTYEPVIKDANGEVVSLSALSYEIDGLEVGELIRAGEEKKITLTIMFNPEEDGGKYDFEGDIEPSVIEQPHGSILATLPTNEEVDLSSTTGSSIVQTTISVINSFQSDKLVTFSIANPNFVLVDSNGNDLGSVLIEGGQTEDVAVYIKLADDAIFSVDSITTGIILNYGDGNTVNCGSIKLYVDIDESFIDRIPPIISNVKATIQNATSDNTNNNNVGSVKITWDVDDENVDYYTVMSYRVNGTTETLLNEYTTNDREYVITGLADANYVFKVYGTDSSDYHNTASSTDIANATTSAGYCSKTASSNFDWHYDVTMNLTYVTSSDNVKKVNRGYNYTTTVTKNADTNGGCGGGGTSYRLPDTITVVMGSTQLSQGTAPGEYTYTGSSSVSSGTITVYGVEGDLTITVKGTSS